MATIFFVVIYAWTPPVEAASADRSDLNNDYTVGILDLEIFSNEYLAQDWQTVDWCSFYNASISNRKYFRRYTSARIERFERLLQFIADSYNCQTSSQSADKSDVNSDLSIDTQDIVIFSSNYLGTFWETIDWCLFHQNTLAGTEFEGRSTRYFLRHFGSLLTFINDNYNCGGNALPADAIQLENTPRFLMRIAEATDLSGDFYITGPIVGSLFIYDASLMPKGEIKALSKPLGVAIDSQGNILVGNDGRDNIEVYDPANGELLAVFGEGLLKMPTAITVDSQGYIYVTDSESHGIQIFDASYNPVYTIGKSSAEGALDFPMDAEIVTRSGGGVANIQEIFVADQDNKRIQVYDLAGNWLRNFTFDGTPGQNCNWMTGLCEIPGVPPFTRLQALDTDSQGRLHVLDSFAASVTIFDPADGAFLGSYGGYGTDGTGPGNLRLPMDVLVSATDIAIVTSGDGNRIEVFTNP